MIKPKNRFGGTIVIITLIVSVLLLAGDVGFWLYNPSRFTSVLSSCVLSIIGGTAEVQTVDTITWQEATDETKLEPGSRVRTRAGSHALLTFAEGTTTKLEPGTDVQVTKMEGKGDSYPDVIRLRQTSGTTWNQVSKLPDNEYHFEIQTPAADVLVRGTQFSVNVDEAGRAFIQTNEGQVDIKAQGQEIPVPAGHQIRVESGATPAAPVPIPLAHNELVINISTPAAGMVIDPSGSSTGFFPDGSMLNQITSSSSSLRDETWHTIRIPQLSTGEYDFVLRGVDAGKANFNIQALSEGKTTFQYTGSTNTTAGSEWLLRLQVDTIGNVLRAVAIVDPKSPQGKATSATGTPIAKTPKVQPDTHKVDSDWLFSPGKGWQVGYWVATALLIILLGIVFTLVYRWR